MIENFLISAGLGCGTVNNFQTEVLKNVKFDNGSRWYFKTPIKYSDSGLKTAVIDLAFPFVSIPDDAKNESNVLQRLETNRKSYEDDLICFFRSYGFIVPPGTASFTIIPFWATEKGERQKLENFGGISIHIINAVLTVKFREKWFV